MATFTVPTVDLATQPLSDFASALHRSSCVFITGHGVSDGLMTAMVDVSTEFFDLPRDLKAPARWPGDGLWRGWQLIAGEHTFRRQEDDKDAYGDGIEIEEALAAAIS